ncbi:MAG: exodeoxyribonuclease VII [Fervidobacterium sp.]|uniref:Uncharacterized protein n=1 Tax=Fervidobacterium gondwanense DSM 13020 TaxID=1121883 RepID=A0A1M7S0T3_FERGO|nr:exodeoxyribonuclease VII [Fervidobacterium gondwanense]UXF00202.1 exodeoxyribonuclease VII [Fervidobacterium riparium]SHN52081.1 hypothetical protein SAMN02745226_00415 [Fervidobacterium gondwanense DSM 13020]
MKSEEITVDKVLELKEADIEKLTFKELMDIIETIKGYFISTELDIEKQVVLYSKAITLLTKAREKLITIKKEKEEIDRKYEEFLKNVEEQ